jgi:ATP-dependent RNA helicase DeaD
MNKCSISSALEQQTELENQLKHIISKEDLTAKRALLEASARHLNLDYLDLAAALLCLKQQPEQQILSDVDANKLTQEKQRSYELINAQMVRYRIEIGRIHKITIPVIKEILVDISGVEHRKIGYIDMFEYYTVLSLPAGMPVDILQLLQEVEVNDKEFDIKRLNGSGKKFRHEKSPRRGTRRHFLSANKKAAHQGQ